MSDIKEKLLPSKSPKSPSDKLISNSQGSMEVEEVRSMERLMEEEMRTNPQ